MSAVAELGPDTAAEHVFARVAVADPGPAGSARAATAHLTLVGAAPGRGTTDAVADGVGTPPWPATGVAARHRGHHGEATPARARGADAAPSRASGGEAMPSRSQPGDGGPARATEPPAIGLTSCPPATGDVRPRVRLVPAPSPARQLRAEGPAGGPPPLLAERIRVLRVDDRSLDPDEPDDRGAPPAADPSLVARRVAGASVEVIVGRRPAAQLARWLAPGVLDVLRTRAAFTRHAASPAPTRAPAVRGVRVCALHEHLVEATAVVDDGRRVRAVALRLETHRGAWRATALEVG